MMILFGGGDGGGYWIDEHGVHKVPPFGPDVFRQLEAVSALARASSFVKEQGLQKEMTAIAERISSAVIPQLLKSAKAGGGPGGVVFMDGDDVVYCGNNGKTVVPIHVGGPHVGGQAMHAD